MAGFCPVVCAVDGLAFEVATISGQHWQLQGIKLALSDIGKAPQQLSLTIQRLTLPKPYHDVSLVNIVCTDFSWQHEEIQCKQGRAQLQSATWQSPTAAFSFQVTQDSALFQLHNARVADGLLSVTAKEQGLAWQIVAEAKALSGKALAKLFNAKSVLSSQGRLNFQMQATGKAQQLLEVALSTQIHALSAQTKNGKWAAEKLVLSTQITANAEHGLWPWRASASFNEGAVYVEPWYIKAPGQPIIVSAQGSLDQQKQLLSVTDFNYQHPRVANIAASADIALNQQPQIRQAHVNVRCQDLHELAEQYLKPLTEATVMAGLSLSGQAQLTLDLTQKGLQALELVFNDLGVDDENKRLFLSGGNGELTWPQQVASILPAEVAWRQLSVVGVPIDAGSLHFLIGKDSIELQHKTKLALLGGQLLLDQFKWQSKQLDDPDVYFEGSLEQVSLEKLSSALKWAPLSGSISGQIPRVGYQHKTLTLGGELIAKVFEGQVKVSKLSASGLLSALPKVEADLAFEHLDLDQLTQHFEFGGVTGKLSGFVNGLILENWQPVSFFAWLGTPDDDDSSHRISQKAVSNIASIGGGGAADVLSRGFLSFFETFMYDKIGLGCFLHDGVCQMMGAGAAPNGYYLVKGGGLPRIDVIGYNPRVDWSVLLERLSRIGHSEDVVVQ
jgi:hypothetical protein